MVAHIIYSSFERVDPDGYPRDFVKKERPDGILVSMGGQTALNVGIQLHERGVFERYNIEVLGTQIPVIEATEDREKFAEKLAEIGEAYSSGKMLTGEIKASLIDVLADMVERHQRARALKPAPLTSGSR